MAEPWPDLPLAAWKDTCDTLHLYTQVVGKVRQALTPREPDWGHIPLYVTAAGLTTSPIPLGDRVFQIDFDLVDHALEIAVGDGDRRVIPLAPRTVSAFHAEVLGTLRSLGIEVEISPRPSDIPDAIPFAADETHASYDPAWAHRFWQVLVRVDTVMKEHRAPNASRASPVHFFWGSFDLALTLFAGEQQVACGFWPGDDRFPEAAFYAYTSPKPDGLESAAVRPDAAFWSPELGEFLLRYEDVRTAASPRDDLLAFFESTYEVGS